MWTYANVWILYWNNGYLKQLPILPASCLLLYMLYTIEWDVGEILWDQGTLENYGLLRSNSVRLWLAKFSLCRLWHVWRLVWCWIIIAVWNQDIYSTHMRYWLLQCYIVLILDEIFLTWFREWQMQPRIVSFYISHEF